MTVLYSRGEVPENMESLFSSTYSVCLGVSLNKQIGCHLKLLKASVPYLPICTNNFIEEIGSQSLNYLPHMLYNSVHISFGVSEDLIK